MPLLCEAGSKHASMHWTAADTGFDAAAATGLYLRAVPVTLRLADREEHVAELTVRIMSGGARSGHAPRVRSNSLCWPSNAFAVQTVVNIEVSDVVSKPEALRVCNAAAVHD